MLRIALLPVVTMMAIQFGYLLGGAVITEAIFGWPGLGGLILDAINNQDYLIVQATMLLLVQTFIVINVLADVCYAVLDPRIRYAQLMSVASRRVARWRPRRPDGSLVSASPSCHAPQTSARAWPGRRSPHAGATAAPARRRARPGGAGVLVLMAVFAPRLAPYDPLRIGAGLPLAAPSPAHPFGTDDLGRDVLSRILFGARISLTVSFLSAAVGPAHGRAARAGRRLRAAARSTA